jgi:hypothetical protein
MDGKRSGEAGEENIPEPRLASKGRTRTWATSPRLETGPKAFAHCRDLENSICPGRMRVVFLSFVLSADQIPSSCSPGRGKGYRSSLSSNESLPLTALPVPRGSASGFGELTWGCIHRNPVTAACPGNRGSGIGAASATTLGEKRERWKLSRENISEPRLASKGRTRNLGHPAIPALRVDLLPDGA